MAEKNMTGNYIKQNWLFLLIAVQPVLDVVAFWNNNSVATAAGYIRLGIMLLLPLYLLFTLKNKKPLIISMCVIGLYCLLHVANCLRVGYINPFFDIKYIARIMHMPIMAICFILLMRDEQTKTQAFRGIWAAGLLTLVFLILAVVTGTYTSTYHDGIGISGWVIDDKRCANSIIFVCVAVFAMLTAAKSERKLMTVLIPTVVTAVLILNGTKACYLSLFAMLLGYCVFIIIQKIVTGEGINRLFVLTLVVLAIVSAAVYPISPRAMESAAEHGSAGLVQNELDEKLEALGYDVYSMSTEEKINNPEIRALFAEYYERLMEYVIPPMFSRFGVDRVMLKYDMTTNADTLIDVRIMKTTYASLIWDECDSLTRLAGFEITEQCGDGGYDMENDWHALFYYCGYIGFGLYVMFALYFVFLILRRLVKDFKGSLTLENFALLLCFVLCLALAHFSGAILRQPNVSIYLSATLALLYYKTVRLPLAEPRCKV